MGKIIQTAGRNTLGEFAPEFAHFNDDVLFGENWNNQDIDVKTRSIITVVVLMASGITDSSLKYHLQNAKNHGVTQKEIAAVITHVAFYAGWPKAWAVFNLAKEVWETGEGDLPYEEEAIKDRYIQSVAPQSTVLLREQVQRIEQGMGRGIRSNDDECCIVLMGDELTDVLSRNRGIDYFSVATRCQYDLSKQLWDLLVSETGSKPTIDQIFELANYSLEKNAEWVATCKENLAAVKYSNEAKVDEKIVAQRKAFENAINMQWSDAANTIKSVKDKEKDKKTKGYLYQIQAEYTNKIDPALSQEVLKAGKKLNAAILSPIAGIQYQRTINTIPQAQAISTNLDAEKLGLNELLVYVDGILANLCMGSEYEKFEEALSQIGTILGLRFTLQRISKQPMV